MNKAEIEKLQAIKEQNTKRRKRCHHTTNPDVTDGEMWEHYEHGLRSSNANTATSIHIDDGGEPVCQFLINDDREWRRIEEHAAPLGSSWCKVCKSKHCADN